MKVQAIVKVLDAPVKKVSKSGHDYEQQIMVLEAQDGEGVARWSFSLKEEEQKAVREMGLRVGNLVEADIQFDTFTGANGFVGNKIGIKDIGLASATPAPPVPSQAGPASDSMAHMQGFNPTMMP